MKKLVPLRAPDVTTLSSTELSMLDQAIAVEKARSASQSSAASHREPGWRMVNDGDSIPYETAFLRRPVVTDQVRRQIAELAAEHALS